MGIDGVKVFYFSLLSPLSKVLHEMLTAEKPIKNFTWKPIFHERFQKNPRNLLS
jgi:hypothetical protein